MKRIKARLLSRRGVAIEFAIGVMFITIAISTILLSTAIHEKNLRARDYNDFKEKIAIEQYAEAVLKYELVDKGSGITLTAPIENDYSYERQENVIVIKEKGIDVLKVSIDSQKKITSWEWQ